MGDHSPADNNAAEVQGEGHRGGIVISHGTGFVLLLLSVCLSVLVGLIVHFASPRQLVCTCNTPAQTVPSLRTEELRDRCVQLINDRDLHICNACPEDTATTKTKPATTTTTTVAATTTVVPNITTVTTTQEPEISYRLPTAIRPHHYVLELQPEIYGGDPSSFTFNGSVSIIVNVTENTSNIILHKQNLIVDYVTLSVKALNKAPITPPSIVSTTYDDVRNFYILHLDGDLDPERSYEINIRFNANLTREGTGGMHYNYYKSDGNETIYLASTLFEPNFARMAFPCFDEPALKATFDITLVRKTTTGRNYISLSNTDIVAEEKRGEYVADIYETSPSMSTYLLAFVVCDFDYLENITANITNWKGGVFHLLCDLFALWLFTSIIPQYRTYARPNRTEYVRTVHQYGLDLLDWFERSFHPDYPLKKLANIAIPGYTIDAMENWGLVTYQPGLLNSPGSSIAAKDSNTAKVTAHEIAHQWFGNLVSPKWWFWLWLSEGVATFLEFHALQVIYPLRRTIEQFVVEQMHVVLAADSSEYSHPMTNDAVSTEDIEEIFDAITYIKGGCIVRMMYFVMGEDLFFKGLNFYLQRHQYGAVEPEDLWDSLTQATINEGIPMNISDIFDPWVTQMNYPLVTVRVVGPGVLNVKQQHFLHDVNVTVMEDLRTLGYRWTIPITYATSANMSNFDKVYRYRDIAWLHQTESEANISDPVFTEPSVSDSWVLVNLHQTGYYRVNYDDGNWMALVKQLELNHWTIPPVNRAQIINDAWALQRTGHVKMEVALGTLNFLKDEIDFAPWKAFSREIRYLDAMLKRSDLYGAFREFMRRTTEKVYKKYQLNIDNELIPDAVPIDILKVATTSGYACKYGVRECVTDATSLFKGWMFDPSNKRIDPNLLRASTCTAVRYGGVAEWNFAYNQYKKSEASFIRSSILHGMACSTHPWLTERMLNMALNDTKIPKSDVALLIQYISEETADTEIIWAFVKNNYALRSAYLEEEVWSEIMERVTYNFNTEYFLKELENFSRMVAEVETHAEQVQDAIQSTLHNIKWISDHHDVIRDWLTERGFGKFLPSG